MRELSMRQVIVTLGHIPRPLFCACDALCQPSSAAHAIPFLDIAPTSHLGWPWNQASGLFYTCVVLGY